jgi:peroxiredoxin (alkyl hydroperoxide reductase subunit C)
LYVQLNFFSRCFTEFEKRNTIVIGASCDTNEVHFAWLNTAKKNGGIEGVTQSLQIQIEICLTY